MKYVKTNFLGTYIQLWIPNINSYDTVVKDLKKKQKEPPAASSTSKY